MTHRTGQNIIERILILLLVVIIIVAIVMILSSQASELYVWIKGMFG